MNLPTYLSRLFLVFSILYLPLSIIAQDDLMSLLEDADTTNTKSERTTATFKTTRLINAQTTETLKSKTLVFHINHRFGNVSDGGHGFYGFDNASNIRFAFDYSLADNWMIGIGRSKVNEHLDGNTKYKILAQTTDNKVPISMLWFSNFAFTPRISPKDINGDDKWTKTAHRFSYTHQLIIARKFSTGFSFEVLPTLVHRNYVNELYNTEKDSAAETNDIISIGFAGRFKLTQRLSLVADYFYTISDFRDGNPEFPYYAPFGVGIEIETGGHVFHVNFTNSHGIIENDFIPNTPEAWKNSRVKLGFNISRVFYL